MGVSIRLAEKDDLPDIVKLNDQIQQQHVRQYPSDYKYPMDTEKVVSFFEKLIDSEANVVIVAISNQSVVGYLYYEMRMRSGNIFSMGKSKFYIHHVLVDQGSRRIGAASSLFKWVESAAIEGGVSEIALDTMERNRDAHIFFEQSGYGITRLRFTKSLR